MALPKTKPCFTVQQYLALERTSQDRHEYLDGVIFAMAGESLAHGTISVNLVALLVNQLKGGPCRVFSKDTKVLSGPDAPNRLHNRGLFSYPDLVVICGKPEVLDDKKDVILNPKIIIEILSPTTESFDREEKSERYQTHNPALTDYILVWQDKPKIEVATRQSDNVWLVQRFHELDAAISVATIGCRLPLKDIYDGVTFDEE